MFLFSYILPNFNDLSLFHYFVPVQVYLLHSHLLTGCGVAAFAICWCIYCSCGACPLDWSLLPYLDISLINFCTIGFLWIREVLSIFPIMMIGGGLLLILPRFHHCTFHSRQTFPPIHSIDNVTILFWVLFFSFLFTVSFTVNPICTCPCVFLGLYFPSLEALQVISCDLGRISCLQVSPCKWLTGVVGALPTRYSSRSKTVDENALLSCMFIFNFLRHLFFLSCPVYLVYLRYLGRPSRWVDGSSFFLNTFPVGFVRLQGPLTLEYHTLGIFTGTST